MIIASEVAMLAFGEELAARLSGGDWLAIDGPLGAGKTVLSKGILRGLGYDGEVASPSYALVLRYDLPDVAIPVSHADLYRLDNADELDELGLAEERTGRITLVEWAERAGNNYAEPSHWISIIPRPDGSRILTLKMGQDDRTD